MTRVLAIALMIVAMGWSSVFAQTSPTTAPPASRTELERLQQEQAIKDALAALNELSDLVVQVTDTRRFKCISAFGSAPFCDCLNDTLAVAADFYTYITVTTQTKEEFGYAKLSAKEKEMADSTLRVREQCVRKVFGSAR